MLKYFYGTMDRGTVPSSSQREMPLLTDLPFDIIINILNRLTWESLFNFYHVCKSWRALLSIRKINMQLNLASEKKYTILNKCAIRHPSKACWKFKIPVELHYPDYMLLDSINGILCICGPLLSHVSYVYLWNPLTKEFKTLPKPKTVMGYVAVRFGFGFVPKSNDYKVVRKLQTETQPYYSQIEIYSLNRNSWKTVKFPCSSSEIIGNESNVVVEHSVETFSMYGSYTSWGTFSWTNDMGSRLLLTFPEEGLFLCRCPRSCRSCCWWNDDSSRITFAGSLVSLNRSDDDILGS